MAAVGKMKYLVLVALLIGVAAPAAAADDANAAISKLQSRMLALQKQLDAMQKELMALTSAQTQHGTGAPPTIIPSSTGGSAAESAGAGLSVVVADGAPGPARPRIYGPAIPTTGAVASIDAGHPVISTSDGRFTASLLGVMQFDVADYFQRAPGNTVIDLRRAGAAADTARARNLANGSIFRRARIGLGGRAYGDFEYSALFDFGGSGEEDSGHVQELWLQYSGWRPAHIRVGAFAPFIGLEDAGSTNGMLFLERPASADVARSLAGGDYREGGQIAVTRPRWFASAALTGRTVNTAGSSTVQPYESQLGFVGRAAMLLVKSKDDIVHLGMHGSYVDHPANVAGPDAANPPVSPIQLRERPELRVDGTRLIDTGAIDARHANTFGIELAIQHRNFLLQSEFERVAVERRGTTLTNPHFNGFYVEGSWIITGQRRRYNDGNFAFDGPAVTSSVNFARGDLGVWEIALRYSDMNLNFEQGMPTEAPSASAIRGGNQKIATAGVNWYLNSIARVMLDYQHVAIDRLSPNAVNFATPVGAQIGQTYSTASARFQLAF